MITRGRPAATLASEPLELFTAKGDKMTEHGYTPQNLRDVLKKNGKTYEDAAEALNCTTNSIQRWTRRDIESQHYRSMSHVLWLALLDWLGERELSNGEALAVKKLLSK